MIFCIKKKTEKRKEKYLKYINFNNPMEAQVETQESLRRGGLPDQSNMLPPFLVWKAK